MSKNFTNPRFEKIYNRQKKQALFFENGLTEEDLSSHYLDGDLFKTTTKKELIAYERGVLRGIKLVDNMLTPVELDPLESPETRFKVIILYAVRKEDKYEISENLNTIQMYNKEEQILVGWSVFDTLLNKKPDEVESIYFHKQDAEEIREKLIQNYYKGGN